MAHPILPVALVTEEFHEDREGELLRARLREAREAGARLAILPELPLDPWVPAGKESRDEDAEGPVGRRHQLQSDAARDAGIAVLGGAIVRDPDSDRRFNTALLYDAEGEQIFHYRKVHIPEEEGFWETSHYSPGTDPPRVIEVAGEGGPVKLGVQICSDINRPQGASLLGALGVDVIAVPRATPTASYARWLLVMRAAAITTPAYVVSVNRTGGDGTPIGGPSVTIAPDGTVLLESEDPVATVTLPMEAVDAARDAYPGYLSRRARVYAEGWKRIVAHS